MSKSRLTRLFILSKILDHLPATRAKTIMIAWHRRITSYTEYGINQHQLATTTTTTTIALYPVLHTKRRTP